MEALNELRDSLYRTHSVTLGNLTKILDFEFVVQQAFRQALHGDCTI